MKNRVDTEVAGASLKRLYCFAFLAFFALAGTAHAALTVSSTTFNNNGRIPDSMTFSMGAQCHGPNISPALAWTSGPAGTLSYAVVVEDISAGNWLHWGIFNIPDNVTTLPENIGSGVYDEMVNSFGSSGYGGPCPPSGTGDHQYVFTVYALNVASLPANASVSDIQSAALDQGTLIGLRRFGEYTLVSIPALNGLGLIILAGATMGCAFWLRRRKNT